MRRSRWLFLVAILCILVWVGVTYAKRKATLAKDAPPPPPRMEKGIDGRANDWVWVKNDGDRPVVEIRAKSFKQITEPSVMQLDQIELRLFHKDATEYDLVKSDQAQFDLPGKTLYADGEVEITMGVPVDSPPRGRVLKIHASGVRFQSDTGKATTDRKTTFEFDQGGGSSVGAEYDPNSRELHLLNQVALTWRGKTRDSTPMHVEAGEAFYKERESKVYLLPWSKLTRESLHVDAGPSTVMLENGEIRHADASAAHGVQDDPGRKVEFGADQLALEFADGMLVTSVKGDRNAKLISTAETARTTVTADQIVLAFAAEGKESILSNAVASGKSVAETQPVSAASANTADTRVLRSDILRMYMRAGGREMDRVETDGPGTVDFLPNRPGQPKRLMKGDRILIAYGADNRIQSFRSNNVTTRTERTSLAGQPPLPPQLTQSKDLIATFDPASSELTRLEQKTDFLYDEGVRHARSDSATLDQSRDLMTLDGTARVWDPSGSASGDRILINQKSGDFTAEGRVASTRQPDSKQGPGGMLSSDEVLQARAQRMVSSSNNRKIHYEGNVVAWQGANRIEADRLDIDRDLRALEAHGKVISQFIDRPQDKNKPDQKPDQAKQDKNKQEKQVKAASSPTGAAPIFTVVRAPDLVYSDETRKAHYTGGAALSRPGLKVTGKEIQAFLKDADQDSSLDKAFADGTVKIVSAGPGRTRTGTSEHAEYYAGEQKVILAGGEPLLVDNIKGQTRGQQLTWFANNDRLLVNGVESKPADTLLRRK